MPPQSLHTADQAREGKIRPSQELLGRTAQRQKKLRQGSPLTDSRVQKFQGKRRIVAFTLRFNGFDQHLEVLMQKVLERVWEPNVSSFIFERNRESKIQRFEDVTSSQASRAFLFDRRVVHFLTTFQKCLQICKKKAGAQASCKMTNASPTGGFSSK